MAVDDGYTVALLHCDGADASTTFTDESGKTWTAHGNAQIDTAQSVFGGASALFDGTGDYVDTPDHADWAFGADPFTLDFRVRWAAVVDTYLIAQYVDADNTNMLFYYSGALYYRSRQAATTIISVASSAWTPSQDTWYHIALCRDGTTFRFFVNGAAKGTPTDADAVYDIAGTMRIGGVGGFYMNGWMDEVRISKGIARWTGAFTPPTAPYGPAVTFVPKIIFFFKNNPLARKPKILIPRLVGLMG